MVRNLGVGYLGWVVGALNSLRSWGVVDCEKERDGKYWLDGKKEQEGGKQREDDFRKCYRYHIFVMLQRAGAKDARRG